MDIMDKDLSHFDKNVDHFLISTHEDQFVMIFVEASTGTKKEST